MDSPDNRIEEIHKERDKLLSLISKWEAVDFTLLYDHLNVQVALRKKMCIEMPLDTMEQMHAMIRTKGELAAMQAVLALPRQVIEEAKRELKTLEDEIELWQKEPSR